MSQNNPNAFTLVELLVVMTIIGALMMLASPALSYARQSSEQTVCQSNIRQVVIGWTMYPIDHSTKIVNGMPDDANGWVQTGPGTAPIEGGKIFTYIGDAMVFNCPSDWVGNERSFSIVAPLRGEHWDTHIKYPNDEWIQSGTDQFDHILDPAKQLVLLEEYDYRDWNLGSWIMYAREGYEGRWIDYMATFHNNGTTMSFADGHAEYWVWDDPDTLYASQNEQFFLTDPGSVDWQRVRDVYRQLQSTDDVP